MLPTQGWVWAPESVSMARHSGRTTPPRGTLEMDSPHTIPRGLGTAAQPPWSGGHLDTVQLRAAVLLAVLNAASAHFPAEFPSVLQEPGNSGAALPFDRPPVGTPPGGTAAPAGGPRTRVT